MQPSLLKYSCSIGNSDGDISQMDGICYLHKTTHSGTQKSDNEAIVLVLRMASNSHQATYLYSLFTANITFKLEIDLHEDSCL